MNNTIKRTTAAITVALLLLLAFPVEVLGEPTSDDAISFSLFAVRCSENIYSMEYEKSADGGLTRKYDASKDYILDVFATGDGRWTAVNADANVTDNSAVFSVSDTLTLDLSDAPLDISWYHELTMNVTATSAGDTPLRISLTVSTTESTYSADTLITPGTDCLLAAPLDAVPDNERISKLTLSVPGAESLTASQIFADNRTLVDFLMTYRAADFSSDKGTLSTTHGKVVFTPEANTPSSIYISSVVTDDIPENYIEYVIVTITSTTSGDIVSLHTGENTPSDLGSVTLRAGTAKYYFRRSSEIAANYFLTFEPSSHVSAYQIDSAELFSFPEYTSPTDESAERATNVKVTLSKDEVTVSGNIPSASVVEYIGHKIAVYELPVGSFQPTDEKLRQIDTFDISTQFNISLKIPKYELDPECSAYAVAILTESGPLFISEPKCAQSKSSPEATSDSIVGVYGATAVGIFESNAAHAVFDVDFALLTGGKNQNKTGTLCSHEKRYFYLDAEMLSTLGSMINFCASSNVNVYLRFFCSEDLSEFGYTSAESAGGIYPFDLTNDDGRAFFTSIFSFIAQRYPNIAGYIYGLSSIPSESAGTPWVFAQSYANVITTARNTLARFSSPAGTYASFRQYNEGAVTSAMMCKMITYYASQNSSAPIGFAWSGDSTDTYERFVSSLTDIGIDTDRDTVMFLTVSDGGGIQAISSDFAKNTESAAGLGLNAVFLCVPESLTDSDIYDSISSSMNALDASRYTYSGDFSDEDTTYSGKVEIWDFSSSFSASGWLGGDGCQSVITELHNYFGPGKRSLEASFTVPQGRQHAGGVVLFKPDKTMKLSSADAFSTLIYATSSSDKFEIKIIFGYGDTRYEYVKAAETNKVISLSCDTKSISDSLVLDYIAIVVRSDNPLKLNISGASALSETMTDTEIRDAVFDADNTIHDTVSTQTRNLATAVIATAFIASAIVFAMLSRRNRKSDQR